MKPRQLIGGVLLGMVFISVAVVAGQLLRMLVMLARALVR